MTRLKLAMTGGAALVTAMGLTWAVAARQGRGAQPAAYSANVVQYLAAGDDQAGYARVLGPRLLRFPEDAGAHPRYQTEWWYDTGNLEAADGRRFGFQLTLFRRALTSAPPVRASAWAADQLYLAHFTVTDVTGGSFHSAERLARGAAGLAGAAADPFAVFLESWSMRATGGPEGTVRLRAADGPAGIDLVLTPAKPVARHGQDGYSVKGPEPGNASFYYSYTRLGATGRLTTTGGAAEVSGQAWMDHEWSTSALGADLVGWDWFALQLDDDRELMVYQLRRADGSAAPASSGSLVAADGSVTRLGRDDIHIDVQGHWTSPRTGGVYPSGWRVRVPGESLDLVVTPLALDQELAVSLRYWEGAVRIGGTAGGRSATGLGYVELTGYAGARSALPGVN